MSGAVEWRRTRTERGIDRWEAHVGEHDLTSWSDGRWRCSGGPRGFVVNMAADLPSAQSAAITAAVGLLVSALASVPHDADWRLVMADPTFGMCVEAVNLERDNYGGAISLARALIAAGVAARGGG